MTEDARFEDAPPSDRPLRLKAEDEQDLAVLSSLLQDAVGRVTDIRWLARHRRLVLLLNRFRWEDIAAAETQKRSFERVRTALTVDGVLKVRARGFDPKSRESVISVLTLGWDAGAEGAGAVCITLAGGAEIRAEAEMLDVRLTDLTKPWEARAKAPPDHEV